MHKTDAGQSEIDARWEASKLSLLKRKQHVERHFGVNLDSKQKKG